MWWVCTRLAIFFLIVGHYKITFVACSIRRYVLNLSEPKQPTFQLYTSLAHLQYKEVGKLTPMTTGLLEQSLTCNNKKTDYNPLSDKFWALVSMNIEVICLTSGVIQESLSFQCFTPTIIPRNESPPTSSF